MTGIDLITEEARTLRLINLSWRTIQRMNRIGLLFRKKYYQKKEFNCEVVEFLLPEGTKVIAKGRSFQKIYLLPNGYRMRIRHRPIRPYMLRILRPESG